MLQTRVSVNLEIFPNILSTAGVSSVEVVSFLCFMVSPVVSAIGFQVVEVLSVLLTSLLFCRYFS